MRKTFESQPSLDFLPQVSSTALARKYQKISEILTQTPAVLEAVLKDLTAGVAHPETGRGAMTAEQVLRCAIVKQMEAMSYRDLADYLADSVTFRRFCLFGDGAVPAFKTLQANIKRLTPQTLESVNQALVAFAQKKKVESGNVARMDCTPVEADVHFPTDNSLLWDCVRVMQRLVEEAREAFLPDFYTPNRCKIVKRLHFQIVNVKGKQAEKKRLKAFRRLFAYGKEVLAGAKDLVKALAEKAPGSLEAVALQAEIARLIPLFVQVLDQGERRVVKGEKLSASEKIFSIFEVHTDIIEKGDRDPVFGHKICVETGKSGMVIACSIPRGNPADSTLFGPMLNLHAAQYGKVPRQGTTDGGFASQANLDDAKERGMKQVLFTKGKGRSATPLHTEMSGWVKQKLARFRAGIEGNISTLKRAFGLTRCTWEGWESFQSYVWASIIGYNLAVLVRHLA